jgi:hypothetical protein
LRWAFRHIGAPNLAFLLAGSAPHCQAEQHILGKSQGLPSTVRLLRPN